MPSNEPHRELWRSLRGPVEFVAYNDERGLEVVEGTVTFLLRYHIDPRAWPPGEPLHEAEKTAQRRIMAIIVRHIEGELPKLQLAIDQHPIQ